MNINPRNIANTVRTAVLCTLSGATRRLRSLPAAGRRLGRLKTLGLALLLPAALVLANDLPFTDVPASGALHDAVKAVFGARITVGTSPTTYSPDDPVTRGQMAFFMQRGFGRVAFGSTSGYVQLPNAATDVASIKINTAGAAGGTGFVKLDAVYTAHHSALSGCPCRVTAYITQDGAGGSLAHSVTIYNQQPGQQETSVASAALTWVAKVPTNTTQTFRLKAYRSEGTANLTIGADLSAIYVPFGSTGGANLNLTAPSGEAEALLSQPSGQEPQ